MRAILYERFQQPPAVRDVPEPVCPPHGVVVRVEATGLCRSDWHGWMGHDPGIVPPHVPGHEFSGVIAEIGDEVRGWTVGERVTTPFVNACGTCAECLAGDHQVCARQTQPGFTHWGSFAEFVAVHHADVNLVRVPESVNMATAASLGCRFATAYRAVVDQGRLGEGPGDKHAWVAVHGCGGVGLSAVMIAASRGAEVVAVDVSPGALERAAHLGAAATVDANHSDVAAAIRELTGGGAHVSLDTLGSTGTFQNSLASLRRRGRHVQVGLLAGDDATQDVAMGPVVANELELAGSHGMAAHHYPRMLDEIAAGRLRPERLLGDELTLEQGAVALQSMSTSAPVGITILRPAR